jgi:hypothetical protein
MDEENDNHVPVKVMAERSNNAPAKQPALSHTDFGLEVCSMVDETFRNLTILLP